MKLIHDSGKHNKFWSYEIDDKHNVVTSWGRLGTKGQSKTFPFYSNWEAQCYADKKVTEKRRKGYKEVEDEVFSLKKLQAELVGAGCKIDELTFVEKTKSLDNRNLYKTLRESAALANPAYEPLIYCSLQFTGKRGDQSLLISIDKVYKCSQLGSTQWLGHITHQYRLEDIEEITDSSSAELKKIRDKAPALVAALIR